MGLPWTSQHIVNPIRATSKSSHPRQEGARSGAVSGSTPGPLSLAESKPDYTRGDVTLNFILAQMRSNPGSEKAKSISRSLEASAKFKKMADEERTLIQTQGIFAGGLGGTIKADGYSEESGAHFRNALAAWYLLVKPDGPWDFKSGIRDTLSPQNIGSDYLPVLQDAWFPVRGIPTYELYYDIWSNIHYAYVGRAIGFDEGTLFEGQNVAAHFGFLGELFAGKNDEGDNIATRAGFAIWNAQPVPSQLSGAQIVSAIRAALPKWLALKEGEGRKAMTARNNK